MPRHIFCCTGVQVDTLRPMMEHFIAYSPLAFLWLKRDSRVVYKIGGV